MARCFYMYDSDIHNLMVTNSCLIGHKAHSTAGKLFLVLQIYQLSSEIIDLKGEPYVWGTRSTSEAREFSMKRVTKHVQPYLQVMYLYASHLENCGSEAFLCLIASFEK